MSTELIAAIANVALTLSLIVGIVFGIAQVKTARRDRRERLTMETLRNYQSREFAEIILFTTTAKFPKYYSEWSALPLGDRAHFVQLMQQMETLGILLADGLIDITLVDKTLGSFVITSWEKYKPLVMDMRERTADPFLAEYFQWLAEKIERRMRDNPRKPFHESN